jgi:hypothetical protein
MPLYIFKCAVCGEETSQIMASGDPWRVRKCGALAGPHGACGGPVCRLDGSNAVGQSLSQLQHTRSGLVKKTPVDD